MKLILMAILMITKTWGGIPTEGDFVLPFSKQGYPLKEFIKDYAEIIKVNISYSSSLLSKREEPLNIYIHDKTSFANYTTLFKSILDSRGYTLIEENGFKWLSPVRDVRFLPIHFYNNQTIPNDESFVTTIIRLKYPVASEITNRVRTFMSRYGRTVGFSDGRSIILTDKGETILKMIETIKFMDTEEVYKAALDKKPKEAKPEDNELNKKIVELELKNKILENKITDKEEKGGTDESITSDSNSSN